MASLKFMLQPRRWYGLQTLGHTDRAGAPFDATPIFVTDVKPLKTGHNLLEIRAVAPLGALTSMRFHLVFKVAHHTPEIIVASRTDTPPPQRLVAISDVDCGWLEQHCSVLWARYGSDEWDDAQERLTAIFGATEDEIVEGVTARSFQVDLSPMREPFGTIPFAVEFTQAESWQLHRGFVPTDMNEKWFIYADVDGQRGILNFRRSWTGNLIYQIPFDIREGRLITYTATVSLSPDYSYGTREQEGLRLRMLISSLLFAAPPPLLSTGYEEVDQETISRDWFGAAPLP